MEETLYLTDLIDLTILQQMQDSFSKMTGVAAYITDHESRRITKGSCLPDFCKKYTYNSPLGCERCRNYNNIGTKLAFKQLTTVTYHCHGGLVVFAAPIMIENQPIGCFHGGQFLDTMPSDQTITELAEELDIDPAEYIAACHRIPILSKEKIQRSALFLHTITNALSSIAYHNYVILEENEKIKRATNLKSDFLANMSHEIRTPMNAIIGMAEMALRENLTETAREYVAQIKTSGKNLLTIINDILDFSKIESGKMGINMAEYEPMSLINDVSNIIMTHIAHKNVQLILDISPDIPYELLGDSMHIRQVLLNLSNNAEKFTKQGYITLTVEPLWTSEDEVILHVSIQDTGIGIKKADLDKLFQSFQQLDSKRNRNLEGTGLGLAISQRLLYLMMGTINVKSTYGKGSTFSFKLPQRITRGRPSIKLKEPLPTAAAGLIDDPVIHKQLRKDIERLKIPYYALKSETDLAHINLETKPIDYLFIERILYTEHAERFVKDHPKITAVLIIDYTDSVASHLPNLLVARKPIYSLNLSMIFNHENLDDNYNNVTDDDYEFIAPDVHILIVDDNSVNLTVAEGLLKPLKLQIDTAQSGKEAISKISDKQYDLIFMDHQMPELDGIETTHIIRRFHEEYATVPIIAFSASASTETEMMFLNEGLNDCVSKPFEIRILISKLKRWLPKEKIKKISDESIFRENPMAVEQSSLNIEGLDTTAALTLLGSEKLLWEVLKDFYQVIRKKAEKIRQLEQQEDWKNYTIEVHALKSASRQIGASELSALAAEMEEAGNACDAARIHQHTASLLEQYLHFSDVLAPYFTEDEDTSASTEEISPETLRRVFADLHNAIDELDMDKMEEAIQELGAYHYEGWQLDFYKQLKAAVTELDIDTCNTVLTAWEQKAAE